jgi:hypothetical protein
VLAWQRLPMSSPRDSLEETALGARCATLAAMLLALLCTLVASTGTSQQWSESFNPPDLYARALLEHARVLRWTVFFDDLFIASYVTASVLFVRARASTSRAWLLRLVPACVLTAGVLDLIENHHILAMLAAAESNLPPGAWQVMAQGVASSLKWLLGHFAFALIGLALPARTPALRAFRASLIGWQLPLGVAVLAQPVAGLDGTLQWLRYGSVLAGMIALALLMARAHASPADAAVGSGAPA